MSPIRIAGIGLAIIGGIAGLIAVLYWYRSSQIVIDPGWRTEPAESRLTQMGWINGTMRAVSETGRLNKLAASCTAVSVLLDAVAAVIGAFA